MDFCEICLSQGNTLLTYNALLLFPIWSLTCCIDLYHSEYDLPFLFSFPQK